MPEERAQRRLAAILAADVVGYSRLMEQDEAGTIERLKAHRKELFQPEIERHRGRIFKLAGDGLFAEFASVVDAVECAATLQRGLAARNNELPDSRRIDIRIGVHVGDVLVEGDDLYGEGVNLAARLESIADPGGVCVSAIVHQHVRTKLDLVFEDMGEQRFKNIAEPVRTFRIRLEQTAPSPSADIAALPLSDKPAVAVLPFANLSDDPQQAYFSDGLSEDLITLLSAWRCFPVIARNSSFAFQGKSRDIRQVARELGARYVLEGSVRKSGERIRVAAQLSDAELRLQIWARNFDGTLDDIFALQDDITVQIVSSVEPELEKAEVRRLRTRRPASLGAWDCYLRGREHLHALTPADNRQARELFERAIELDSDYAAAAAGLSITWQRDMLLETAEDRAVCERKALEWARRAVALDAESSFAHYALSGAFIWANEHTHAIAEARTAVQLNPSDTAAWLALANRLDIAGASAEGIPLLEATLRRNPRDPHNHTYYAQLGRAYINARNYTKALDVLREAVRLRPDFPNTYHVLAICLGHLGRLEEARAAARRCEELRPGFFARRVAWNIYVDPEANAHLEEGLRKAGLVP
jgi:adenylate cyclase